MVPKGAALLLLLLCLNGCLRREGRNTDCNWPRESDARPLDTSHFEDRYHLSRDAEYAEELAIAFADRHHGLRTGHFVSAAVYARERDRCMATLFQQIANDHRVEPRSVAAGLEADRLLVDTATNLPVVFLYLLVALVLVRQILRRYPPHDGWTSALVMLTVGSFLFALIGSMAGEFWAMNAESVRNGSGHISYRAMRLVWARYPGPMYALLWLLFWAAAAFGLRTHRQKAHSAIA